MKKFFSVILLIFFFFPLSSQIVHSTPIIFSYEQDFRFRPGRQAERYEITNYLLQTIAEGNQKLRVFTSYNLTAKIHLIADETPGKIKIRVAEHALQGDINYRAFSIRHILLPQMLEFSVVARDDSGKALYTQQIKDFSWQQEKEKTIVFHLADNKIQKLHYEITDIEFYYPAHSLALLEAWSEALASYYKAEQWIEKANESIVDLSFDNPETVLLNEFKLCEAEALLGDIRFLPFHQYLFLDEYDPLDIANRYNKLKEQIAYLRSGFNFAITHIDSLFYEMAKSEKQKGNFNRSKELYNRTISFNPLHVPANIALAEFYLLEGSAENALKRIKSFLGRIHPAGIWNEQAIDFAIYLFNLQIKHARSDMADGRYLDALNKLKILESFCLDINLWNCPDEMFLTLQEAHAGMYQSYLSVAHRAYRSANYSFTETYLESALNYQKAQIKYLPDDSDVTGLLLLVHNDYIRNSENARFRMDFDVAENYIARAIDLCNKYELKACRTEQLAQTREEIKEGKLLAERMPVAIRTTPATAPVRLDLATARQMVIDHLSQGHLNAWAGRTEEARANLNLVSGYYRDYNLSSDTLISIRIISLRDMIREKECEINERNIQSLIHRIEELMGLNAFVESNIEYNKLLSLINSSESCTWDYTNQISKYAFLSRASQYQNMMSDARNDYFTSGSKGYINFFKRYVKAETFYQQHQLKEAGVKHTSLGDFIENSSNEALKKESIGFFSSENQHQKALDMLENLRISGMRNKDIRTIQEIAGQRAAQHFKQEQSEQQPKDLARQLTHGNAWYRYYVGSFVKSW